MTTTPVPAPFDQAYYPRGPLTIAFESGQVTYHQAPGALVQPGSERRELSLPGPEAVS